MDQKWVHGHGADQKCQEGEVMESIEGFTYVHVTPKRSPRLGQENQPQEMDVTF